MSNPKALSVKEQTVIDALKKALHLSPAEKIRASLQLSGLCSKLFKSAAKKK